MKSTFKLTLVPDGDKPPCRIDRIDPTDAKPKGWSYGEWDRERSKKARIYLFRQGQTVIENLFERWSNPVKDFKEQLLPSIEDALNVKFGKVVWSQKAGCSCGCSPGFIVQDPSFKGATVYAHYSVAE